MKLTLEKTKAFWIYIVGGALAMILGGMLMPVWKAFENELFFRSWGEFSVYIMISVVLFAYIFLYLIKRIKRYSTTPAQIVAIVELVLMVVIAVVCTVSAFVDFISFGEPCRVFGLAVWARGVSGVFTGYYCDSSKVKKNTKGKKKEDDEEPSGNVDDFTVWRLVVSVAMISAGTFFFIEPLIEALTLQWLFSCTIILVGAFFTVYGIFLKPVKIKVEKPKEVKLDETKKEAELPKEEEKEELKEAPSIKISLNATNEINETKEVNAITDTASLDAIKEEKEKKEEKAEKKDKKDKKTDTPTALVPTDKK